MYGVYIGSLEAIEAVGGKGVVEMAADRGRVLLCGGQTDIPSHQKI